MNIIKTQIVEKDIPKYIEDRLSRHTWSEIFFEMKKEVETIAANKKNTDLYSMPDNYTPIFMYYAIQQKCDIEEFIKILQLSNNYEYGLNRFFGYADCNYDEKENSSIYDKMKYLFFKKDIDGKIIFNENKIDYIYEIIKNTRNQNLLDFHSSRIDFFLSHVIKKDKKIAKQLINLLGSTENMLKEEHKNYPSMPMSIIRIFADESYEKDVSEIYNLFKENKVFHNLMFKNIIQLDYSKKYKTNMSLYKMISQNEENYFEIFINRVRELKYNLEKKEYSNLIQDILFSIENGVKENPFQLNLEKININHDILDNIPYLVALEKIIESGSYNLIIGHNENLNKYLNFYDNEVKKYDKGLENISFDEYYVIKKIEFNTIKKFFEYQRLDEKLKSKSNKIIKTKI